VTADVQRHYHIESSMNDGVVTAVKVTHQVCDLQFESIGWAVVGSDDTFNLCKGIEIAQKRACRAIVDGVVDHILTLDAVDIMMVLSRVAYNEMDQGEAA